MKYSNRTIFILLGGSILLASAALTWKKEISDRFDVLSQKISSVQLADTAEVEVLPEDTTPDPHFALLEKTFQQGIVMLHAKEYELAITAFHKVLEIRPDMPEAFNNIGYALIGLEEYLAAEDFFTSALDLNENLISAYFGLALTFGQQEKWPLAIGSMETYRHRTTNEDPFLKQANEHLMEWRDKGRNPPPNS